MAFRTTYALVAGVIKVKDGVDINPYILPANELVTELLADVGHTDGRLRLIETWLAAHFLDINYARPQGQTAGPVQEQKEQVKVDLHLNNTKYGQQAMLMDTSGILAAWNNALDEVIQIPDGFAKPSRTRWLGTPISDY